MSVEILDGRILGDHGERGIEVWSRGIKPNEIGV